VWTAITDGNQPMVAGMKTNFAVIFDAALTPLYARYGKPMSIVAAYPSIDGGMKGGVEWADPAVQVWNEYTDTYALDLVEQAEGYEALLQVITETPYVTGLYPFTYMPLSLPPVQGVERPWQARGSGSRWLVRVVSAEGGRHAGPGRHRAPRSVS